MSVTTATRSATASAAFGSNTDSLQDTDGESLGDDPSVPAKMHKPKSDTTETNLPAILDASTCDVGLQTQESDAPREGLTRYRFQRNTWYEYDISLGKLHSGTFAKNQPAVGNRQAFTCRAVRDTYGLTEGIPIDKAGRDPFVADGVSIAGKGSGSFILQGYPKKADNGVRSFDDSRVIRVKAANNGILLVCRLAAAPNPQLGGMFAQDGTRCDVLCKVQTGENTGGANVHREESYVARDPSIYEAKARQAANMALAAVTAVATPGWTADDTDSKRVHFRGLDASRSRASLQPIMGNMWTHTPLNRTHVSDGMVDISGAFAWAGSLPVVSQPSVNDAKAKIKTVANALVTACGNGVVSRGFTGPLPVQDAEFSKIFVNSVNAKLVKAFSADINSADWDKKLDRRHKHAVGPGRKAKSLRAGPSQHSQNRVLGGTG
jgi:hypothetical protein